MILTLSPRVTVTFGRGPEDTVITFDWQNMPRIRRLTLEVEDEVELAIEVWGEPDTEFLAEMARLGFAVVVRDVE